MAAKWPLVAVEEFAEVATGGTPSTSIREYWEGGTIPWLNSGELNKGVITDSENFVTEAGLKNSSARMMPENTVLVALTGATTGISALLKIEACANQSVTGVLPSEKHDPSFLIQYLRSIRDRIVSDSWGGAQKHISQGYVKELKIPLPPLEEQRRIAEVLDRAEALRAKRRAALAQLDSLTQSLFLDLFGDPISNPRKWPQENLETFFHFRTGKLDSNAAVAAGQYPFFTCSRDDFRIDTFAFDCEALLLAGNNASADYSVKHYKGKFNAYQRTYVITLRDERNSYDYSRFVLEHRLDELKRMSKGTGTKYLTMELLNRIRVPVPPISLQREFARRVTAVEALKTAQRVSLAELDALFATLQHRAFRGEL